MHHIYASAEATIIVACNTCADDGILCHIQSNGVDGSSEWPHKLRQSAWSKRAWTFQEMQLSRRLIVITHNGIHFHCAKAGVELSAWNLPTISYVSSWSAYDTILAEYTSRQLSYKADTLNAIAGMARTLARFTDDSFWAGIPSKQIVFGLLWQPTGPSIRQLQWPSWSWAGWTGRGQSMCTVFYPSSDLVQENHDRDPMNKHRLWSSLGTVVFHVADSDIQLTTRNQTKTSGSPDRSLEHCDYGCKDECSRLQSLTPEHDKPFYNSGILSFKAEILKLTIQPTSQRSPKYTELFKCRLLIGNSWIGSMFLAGNFLPTTEVIDAEFLVLTRFSQYLDRFKTSVFGGMLGPDPGMDDCFLQRAQDEYERNFKGWTDGRYHERTGWHRHGSRSRSFVRHMGPEDDPHFGMPFPARLHMMHVLWIERDTNLDLAYRKGIGVINYVYSGQKETSVRLA